VDSVFKQLKDRNTYVFAISAATHTGTREVINLVMERLKAIPKNLYSVPIEEDHAACDHDDSSFNVYRHKKAFIVDGGRIKRLINVTDLTNNQAVYRLQNILKSMGVFEALIQAGIKEGDQVIIDKFEFEYSEDI